MTCPGFDLDSPVDRLVSFFFLLYSAARHNAPSSRTCFHGLPHAWSQNSDSASSPGRRCLRQSASALAFSIGELLLVLPQIGRLQRYSLSDEFDEVNNLAIDGFDRPGYSQEQQHTYSTWR